MNYPFLNNAGYQLPIKLVKDNNKEYVGANQKNKEE